MNNDPTQDTLELEVRNFGPIVEAKLDLRPLTVFIGPSNTGKSYLAILIYALHQYFSGQDGLFSLAGRRRPLWRYGMFWEGREKLAQEIIDVLFRITEQLAADEERSQVVLPDLIAAEIRSVLDAQGGLLGNEIGRCFGIGEIRKLIRKGKGSSANVALRKHLSNGSAPAEHRLEIRARGAKLEATIPEMKVRNTEYLRHIAVEATPEERTDFSARLLLASLTDLVQTPTVAPLHLPAFYLPADRTGVMHAHSAVVSAMIGSASKAGLRPTARTPMLSGVLADFLEQLIELDQSPYRQRKSSRSLDRVSREIEEAVLYGSVHIERSGVIDYPSFTYRPQDWKDNLPLMNASSMVSELAPVVLYLRHMVEPNNVLIVEEPESHLHPAMQVEFTRQLAELVHSGVRVIVTTHSEWVLEELANIVQRSKLSKAHQNKPLGKVALHPDQVGVWLFKKKPKGQAKGSEVTEIPLDDSGLYPSGFDDVAAALHRDWVEISNRTGETE